jgi:multiple sugar transport system permease protein
MIKGNCQKINIYAFSMVAVAVFGFPIFWIIISAFKPPLELFTVPIHYIPRDFTLCNFIEIFFESDFPRFLLNSIIVAIGVIILNIITSTMSGYGLTRYRIYGKKTLARIVLFSYMFPPMILVIPQFIIWQKIALTNTYIGIILAQTAIALPFSVWLMWKYFQTIPVSLEESAWVFGAESLQSFYQIALPQAKPGIVAVSIFSFAVSWNDFTMSNILLTLPERQTLPVGILTFIEGHAINWGEIMASCFFLILPGFLLVYFLQKYILQGFRVAEVA